jgi:hypothetical protein
MKKKELKLNNIYTYSIYMVQYFCLRCCYETHNKTYFNNHLNRKFICKPTLSDVSIEEVKEHYNLLKNNAHNCTQIALKCIQPTISCQHCNQTFTRVSSLRRHSKKCKEIEKHDNLIIKQLEKELEKEKKKNKNLLIHKKINNCNTKWDLQNKKQTIEELIEKIINL